MRCMPPCACLACLTLRNMDLKQTLRETWQKSTNKWIKKLPFLKMTAYFMVRSTRDTFAEYQNTGSENLLFNCYAFVNLQSLGFWTNCNSTNQWIQTIVEPGRKLGSIVKDKKNRRIIIVLSSAAGGEIRENCALCIWWMVFKQRPSFNYSTHIAGVI